MYALEVFMADSVILNHFKQTRWVASQVQTFLKCRLQVRYFNRRKLIGYLSNALVVRTGNHLQTEDAIFRRQSGLKLGLRFPLIRGRHGIDCCGTCRPPPVPDLCSQDVSDCATFLADPIYGQRLHDSCRGEVKGFYGQGRDDLQRFKALLWGCSATV